MLDFESLNPGMTVTIPRPGADCGSVDWPSRPLRHDMGAFSTRKGFLLLARIQAWNLPSPHRRLEEPDDGRILGRLLRAGSWYTMIYNRPALRVRSSTLPTLDLSGQIRDHPT